MSRNTAEAAEVLLKTHMSPVDHCIRSNSKKEEVKSPPIVTLLTNDK